jgi:hypothetical protein
MRYSASTSAALALSRGLFSNPRGRPVGMGAEDIGAAATLYYTLLVNPDPDRIGNRYLRICGLPSVG